MKRVVISALWFVAIWGSGGYLSIAIDVARSLTIVPACAVAALVWVGLGRYERHRLSVGLLDHEVVDGRLPAHAWRT